MRQYFRCDILDFQLNSSIYALTNKTQIIVIFEYNLIQYNFFFLIKEYKVLHLRYFTLNFRVYIYIKKKIA